MAYQIAHYVCGRQHSIEETESRYQDLNNASLLTSLVLKDEWQKLKREVADPEKLIADILATSASGIIASAARAKDASSGASAVPSTRPTEIPLLTKAPPRELRDEQ